MRVKSSQKNTAKDGAANAEAKAPQRGLAQVAIQFGRYVSLQTQQLLQEIRESQNPPETVRQKSLKDFADAGMEEFTDPFQSRGLGKSVIESIRNKLSS